MGSRGPRDQRAVRAHAAGDCRESAGAQVEAQSRRRHEPHMGEQPSGEGQASSRRQVRHLRRKKKLITDLTRLSGAVQSPMPAAIVPMKATLVDKPPRGEDWLFEIKWDGVRSIAF